MKKTLIIALCCMAMAFVSCHKPDPTPNPEDSIDYTPNYVGNYIGSYTFLITSMNNQPQSNMSFPMDNIVMDITKGSEDNVVMATVTVDNETRQTTGKAMEGKVDFDFVHLTIDKPDQGYRFALDLKMEGTKDDNNNLNITGSFSGNGSFIFLGTENILDEVSGTLTGTLVQQPVPEEL